MDFLVVQFLNGLASASALFLVASGLSIIFGVTRVVNFAHGSFYMLGAYVAYTLVEQIGAAVPGGFWIALVLAAAAVALLGALIETTILRRIYRAPELFQLLATFGVVLIVQDLVILIWGPQDLQGPRAPGLEGAISIFGSSYPVYDLMLIALGAFVLLGLGLLFRRTRWGVLVRAATQDREMVAALGVRQSRLFTGVFILGAFLAGLGGAVQLPRASVNHAMDLQIIVETFVVVVVGGLGSVPGAYLAAVLLGELNAFGIVVFPGISLVLAFLVMAVVLVVRPWGLLGRAEAPARTPGQHWDQPLRPMTRGRRDSVFVLVLALAILPVFAGNYALGVMSEVLIFALFAASLHFLMGVGGMVSFGHAAYFGLGAYGAALATTQLGLPMAAAAFAGPALAGVAALVFGWFCVRLTGVYLAMLTLAFAQITWSVVFQWYDVTGGDNGILGVWPSAWASSAKVFYYLTLAIAGTAIAALRQFVFAPFGMGLRACRDSALRAEAIGIDRAAHQRHAFLVAGSFAGIAGALYAFLKGSVFPDVLGIPMSVDGLVMVLLGGVQTLTGPVVGAAVYKTLQVFLATYTDYWRLVVGVVVIALVVAFPRGIAGYAQARLAPLLGPGGKAVVVTLLAVRGLRKSFGGIEAVAGIDFDLAAGEVLALIGPNGAGKSTCFNMLNGQLRPDAGTIVLDGRPIAGLAPRRVWRLGVGRTFQITATFASMSVLENVQTALLSFHRRLRSFRPRASSLYLDEAYALIELVGMADQADRLCSVLAYGDLKRLELAVALANAPKLLLMDEPTAGMAPGERVELMRLAAAIAAERTIGILFTEHDMDVVFAHATRVMVLDRGRLLAIGPPAEVRANPAVQATYLGEEDIRV